MTKFYFTIHFALAFFLIIPSIVKGQDCSLLSATFTSYESRCAATGSIKIVATGGSGSYKYKTLGPVNSNFTTSDSITGLSAGNYAVIVTDIVTNCTFTQPLVTVAGTYQDPRFALTVIDVSCDNGNNGSITANGQQFGRAPFVYSIEAPSSMGIGTFNSTGFFNNLASGNYTIRMTDSCGGIQTREITINDYTWYIDSYNFNKNSCDSASGYIKVVDSKGNISTVSGISGFMYGVVRQPGDTIWSASPSFQFNLGGRTTFEIIAKDNCGNIKKAPVSLVIKPVLNAVVISSQTCNYFTVSVSGIGFYSPYYCLSDGTNALVGCNSTGVFTNLPYGNYCVGVLDSCTNLTVTKCFTVIPPPIGVSNTVIISNKLCATFTAAITGQTGLTNPSYCLVDSLNFLITCNTTGIFNNLSYGSYCVQVTDGCRDTTIKVCFLAYRPIPAVSNVILPGYSSCTNFGVIIGGSNLQAPRYCLYDSAHVLIVCNSTGIFNGLTFGSYCANVYDSCFDTTFVRCFTVGPPIIINDIVTAISNKTCSIFTVAATSNNINKPSWCLYNASDSLISCDSSGIFNNLIYGSYCIRAKSNCPDTTLAKCFTVFPNLPSVNTSVKISNTACKTFSAQVSGQLNLTNPNYCLYDSANVQITCNTTGQFDSLLYGKYCIKIVNTCYDTTIIKCFTVAPISVKINVSSNQSCAYNYAKFSVSVLSGSIPFNVKIYTAGGSLLYSNNYNNNSIIIDSIPGTIPGQPDKVIVTDNCGTIDSANIDAIASYVTHHAGPVAKCPSGTFVNGSGDIAATVITNMGSVTTKIISKDNTALSPQLSPNTVIGRIYTFQDLGPGLYIISYTASDGCNVYLYDTVVVSPYKYPTLSRSSAYQCDINGFSLGAVVSNGVGPFTYEIIGSTPATPSIIAPPQTNPVFYINNATKYSLVRMRALDGCGNATLADASILPLANMGIVNTFNCFLIPTTLSLDTVYNSTYAWYKKTSATSTDSTYLGSAASYFIPLVLPADTGVYVCNLVVNGGCIARTYNYHLDGSCSHLLAVTLLDFTGKLIDEKVMLNWNTTTAPGLKYFIIERQAGNGGFVEVGQVNAGIVSLNVLQYHFADTRPAIKNNYRIKLIYNDDTYSYSNIIMLNQNPAFNIQIYPNPVDDILNIVFKDVRSHSYKIKLLTSLSQVVKEINFISGNNNNLQIVRTKNMSLGMYILKIIDTNTNEEISQKIIFR